MKKIFTLLFVLIIAVIITSCHIAVERVPLMAYQKQMIPYQKGQKVCFTNAQGDSSLFITTDIITEWSKDDGAIVEYWIQKRKVNLQSESGDLISLYMQSMDADAYDYCDLNLKVKGFHFSLPFDCTGKFYPRSSYGSDSQWRVYDSLAINDKVYYDVAEEDHGSMQLYYNKTYGILQVKQDGQNQLTLQQ